MSRTKNKSDLLKTLLLDLINIISDEKKSIKNSEYIKYMFDKYQSENDDNRFIEWCDVGYEILNLWHNMYQWIDNEILNISLSDIIDKIKNSNLISDIDYWTLNYQQFRNNFTDIKIVDICEKIDQIYLTIQTLLMNYKKVQSCENS